MPSPDEREARRQTHLRDVNEWIEGAHESVGLHHGTDSFRCECGDTACRHVIELTRAEYEWVRASAIRFALAPNHEHPGDRVVAELERYTVVEKLVGRQSGARSGATNGERRATPQRLPGGERADRRDHGQLALG